MRKRKPKSLYDMMMEDFYYQYQERKDCKDIDIEKVVKDVFDDYNVFFKSVLFQTIFRIRTDLYFMSMN